MAVAKRELLTATEMGTASYFDQVLALRHMDEWQRLTDESATLLKDGEIELAAAAEIAAGKELALVESLLGSRGAADEAKVAQGELIGEYDRTPTDVSTKIVQEEMAYARSQVRNYIGELGDIPRSVSTTLTIRRVTTTEGEVLPVSPVGGAGGYAAGTPYVPETGFAYLHQGEAVLPRDEAQDYRAGRGGGGTIIIAPIILERSQYTDANGELMFEQIAEMIQAQQGAF